MSDYLYSVIPLGFAIYVISKYEFVSTFQTLANTINSIN